MVLLQQLVLKGTNLQDSNDQSLLVDVFHISVQQMVTTDQLLSPAWRIHERLQSRAIDKHVDKCTVYKHSNCARLELVKSCMPRQTMQIPVGIDRWLTFVTFLAFEISAQMAALTIW